MKIATNKKRWYIVCVGLAVVSLTTFAFLNSTTYDTSPPVGAADAPIVHGGFVDALDSDEPGEPVENVLQRLDRVINLPDSMIVGEVVKAVDSRMEPADPSGLLVLYSSGIKVKIVPGKLDIATALKDAKGAKVAGSENPFRIENLAGRPTWVAEGGKQQLVSGELEVPKLLTWNIPGYIYTLETASESSVSLEDLKRAAQSIK